MAELPTPITWQDLFNQHHLILEKHIETLGSIQTHLKDDTPGSAALTKLVAQAKSIAHEFQSSREAFSAIDTHIVSNGALEKGNLLPKTNLTFEEVNGNHKEPIPTTASDLFSIDINPTPLDQLLAGKTSSPAVRTKNQAQNKGKRKASNELSHLDVLGADPVIEEQTAKRARLSGVQQSKEDISDIHEASLDDPFDREVEARHREKEERRRKKSGKKRKRESGASLTETVTSEGQNSGREKVGSSRRPQQKKRKKNKSPTEGKKRKISGVFRGKNNGKNRKAEVNGKP